MVQTDFKLIVKLRITWTFYPPASAPLESAGIRGCVTTPGLFDAGNQNQGFLHVKQAFN